MCCNRGFLSTFLAKAAFFDAMEHNRTLWSAAEWSGMLWNGEEWGVM